MKKNFYNILGVDTNAKPNHIKNAFRKLSLQFHPDKMGGDVEKFKEINEAYQILSDPEKKTDYDSIKTGGMINPEDIFKMFFDGSNFEGVSFGIPFGFGGNIQEKCKSLRPS